MNDIDIRVYRNKLEKIKVLRLDFANNHHVNTHGEPLDFTGFPHIKELYNTVAAEIVIQGSVQCLKSEWLIVDHLAMAFSGLSLFFVLPKVEHRGAYVQNRINRCVQSVPRYKEVVDDGFFNSVVLKSFGKGVIKYVGSNVLADFREHPADALYVDEVDECDQGNLVYAVDRLGASRFRFKRYIGNPGVRGYGINKLFQESDGREWYAPCDKCGELIELDWFQTVAKEMTDHEGTVVDYQLLDTTWEPGCKRDIYCMCPACDGGVLIRDSQLGVWKAKRTARMVGYHISKLCTTLNSITDMWLTFQSSQTDPALLQHFFNSDLGLPFVATGNKVTESLLDNCVQDEYNLKIESDCAHIVEDSCDKPCSMGIDVGAVFDVRISMLENNKRRMVFVGKVSQMDALYDLVERYSVEKAVIDSGPESRISREFQELADCNVWLCRYRGEGTDRRIAHDLNQHMINVDRTEALDRSFAQLRRKKNILPANYAVILGGQWMNEMCIPIRQVMKDSRGNSRFEWTKGKDHARHADTYDMLAADLMDDAILDGITIV